jgi:integrase
MGKLTDLQVRRARGPGRLPDGDNLYLDISVTGAKSWTFRYQLNRHRRDMGVGPYPVVSLAEARERAQDARKLMREGIDPIEHRRAQQAAQRLAESRAKTFRELAEDYIARNEAGWRNAKHRQQWRHTLRDYVYPVIGDLPIAAVDTNFVMQILDPIWGAKPETASRVRGRIERIIDYAIVRGFRDGPNPAQWRGGLAHILPPRSRVRRVVHHAALPIDEMPEFMAALRAREGVSARCFEFLILTAARTGEALGATWREIDFAQATWTVPAARMKAGRAHRIPLSKPAIHILESVSPMGAMRDGRPIPAMPVFPGMHRALPLSNMALAMVLRRMKRDDLTAHGCRSVFRDWAAERTSFPRDVVEMALAHAVENRVEAAYFRSDLFEKRRALMEGWAKFCLTPTGDTVVPLRAV